jgi:tRNA(Ile)-lysidine synthase
MTQDALHPLESNFIATWPRDRWQSMRVAVACSGGADSVALLRAAVRLRPAGTQVMVLHFNHQLRGAASDEDEAFVVSLASTLNCSCIVGRTDGTGKTASIDEDGRLMRIESRQRESDVGQSDTVRDEASLRAMRYRFLEQAANSLGIRYVALAHTADDQIETALLNLFRGTGLAGLAGIKPFRPISLDSEVVVARPLLGVHRSTVESYLEQLEQAFRHDMSNFQDAYTRNWIRLELLPAIESRLGTSVRTSMLRAIQSLGEVQQDIEQSANQWFHESHVRSTRDGFQIDRAAFINLTWPVALQVLRRCWSQQGWGLQAMNAEHWTSIRQFVFDKSFGNNQRMATILPGAIQLQYRDGLMCFHRNTTV